MKLETEVPRAIRRVFQATRGWGALVVLVVLALALALAVVSARSASAADGDIEVWPSYYDLLDENGDSTPEDEVVQLLMGPGGNSANPNQLGAGTTCFNLGPAGTGPRKPGRAPVFYFVFYPDDTPGGQMWCKNEDGEPVSGTRHDMILTAVPGDRGYNATIEGIGCFPGTGFDPPYTSVEKVLAHEADEKLVGCVSFGTQMSPVVRGP